MLLCFPVPPSKRQAAGPLTENLPNVLVCGPQKLGDQLSSPAVPAKRWNVLPYETPKSRLIFRVPHPRFVRVGSSVWRMRSVRLPACCHARALIAPSGRRAAEPNPPLVAAGARENFWVHS
jgi:hypothetical protein